jgi:hypothetical protein
MAPMVLMAPLLAPIWFLKPTERRFLSSMVKSSPYLVLIASYRKLTMSSNFSAYSETLAKKIFSSSDDICEFKILLIKCFFHKCHHSKRKSFWQEFLSKLKNLTTWSISYKKLLKPNKVKTSPSMKETSSQLVLRTKSELIEVPSEPSEPSSKIQSTKNLELHLKNIRLKSKPVFTNNAWKLSKWLSNTAYQRPKMKNQRHSSIRW